ncbi:hypothetical protein CVD25_04390 [Bacillus canaveralius]|uniref:Uncharacterized protein n=1 Tax=Bacillus canaveralius TaxID=1403243 RepID=A0A2N5GRA4_9BACI|nr:hypothetical protein [Bacillus canaveralius]PLR85959.1 hypothetical protein CU635_02680 [Bacillus canaveralius]PLS00078.1 hypothetical protein CVD25_04390 [Bacillus canaveralius]RSK50550.1 hypothetical protein EJA13_14740 [Bacillus canaveralius]
MIIHYGVEANHLIGHVPEFIELVRLETSPADEHDSIFIYRSTDACTLAKNLLIEGELYEDVHMLILLTNATTEDVFPDYGFVSKKQNHYLFKSMVSCFLIINGDKIAIEMAQLQMEEHLVARTKTNDVELFFITLHDQELIGRIAKAYNIEVSFLDLDKPIEKL